MVAPTPVAKPAPAAPAPAAATPARGTIAAVVPAPALSPLAAPKLDAKLVENIFACLAPGLPQDWKKTWVVVTGLDEAAGRRYETKFYYSNSFGDDDGDQFVPCNSQEVTRRITGLSDTLPPDRRNWKTAKLVIDNEGDYELKYDYK